MSGRSGGGAWVVEVRNRGSGGEEGKVGWGVEVGVDVDDGGALGVHFLKSRSASRELGKGGGGGGKQRKGDAWLFGV